MLTTEQINSYNEKGYLVSPLNNEASSMFGIKIYGNIVIVGKIINS